MSYAAFGRAHDSVCHFKLAGHPARVCRHSVELATQVWLAEHLSRTFELPATPRTMHHAPCTTHHAPCTMHRFTVPCTAHGVPHTAGIYHRVLGTALCTTHPSAYHILDGAVHCTPFTMHHHHAPPPCIIPELTRPPVHCTCVHVRYDAVPQWDDCSCVRIGCVFYWFLCSFPSLGQSQSTS